MAANKPSTMAAKIKTAVRYCEYCGRRLYRKRVGRKQVLENFATFCRRLYCDSKCMGLDRTREFPSLETVAGRNSDLPKKRRCEMCGRRRRLGTHHIDRNKENNDPSNRMTLCPRCHTKWHWQHGKPGKPKTNHICFCGEPARELGMCLKHYQRFKRHGDPMLVKVRNGGLVRAEL